MCTDDIVVEDNWVHDNETGIAVCGWMWLADGVTAGGTRIIGNRVEGNVYGISLQDKSYDTLIQGNLILDNYEDGVDVCNFRGYPVTGTVITGNIFYGNNPDGLDGCGALWVDSDITETVDAEGNWWGHASGPYHETLNPEGQGGTVIGRADFDPGGRAPSPLRPGSTRTGSTLSPRSSPSKVGTRSRWSSTSSSRPRWAPSARRLPWSRVRPRPRGLPAPPPAGPPSRPPSSDSRRPR